MATPKIRLKGFEGEWKTRKLGEITQSFSGGTPSVGVAEYYGGNIPFIRSGEIHYYKTEMFLTEAGLNNSSAKIVDKGTLLFALYGATSGEVDIAKIRGAINQAILAIIPNSQVNNVFLSNYLLYKKNKIVGELLQGGQGNLSAALIKSVEVKFPNLSEQSAIASYFQSLDTLIQTTEKKIDSLKQMKAASLISMFPQEGETTPKVRFKGFEGEWKEVSFKDITYLSGIKNRDNLPMESYSISNELGFIPQNEQFENGGTMSQANKTMYYIVSPDSFAYNPARINVGSIGYYYLQKDVIVSSLYVVFKTDDETYNPFLYIWFKSPMFNKLITLYQEGGVRLYFFYDKLCACKFRRPCFEEQQAIASYFTNLENQISLHTQRLEKLKNIKAECLNKMFV